jgi:hypothetical protein
MWLINALLAISLLFHFQVQQQQQESSGWTPNVDPDQFGEGYQDFLREIPKFDLSRAWYDPFSGCWNDGNYCVYPNEGGFGLWGIGTFYREACGDADFCGIVSGDVIGIWAKYKGIADLYCANNTCIVRFKVGRDQCPPDHPLCKDIIPPVVDRGLGGGGGGGDRNPPGGADSCPAPEVIRESPPARVEIESLPPYPVVVGQDPDRKGVIYRLVVRVSPAIFRCYEKEPDVCVPVPDANGDGKPDRSGSCWTQIGDPPVRWPGDLKAGGCRLVEERYPDPVAGDGRLEMILSPSSHAWIEGELAARYPGARVRMPEIRMPIRGQGEILADKTFVLRAEVNPKPVDPGIYRVEFLFRTSGTPVSQPIEVRRRIEQKVWLMESAIVR